MLMIRLNRVEFEHTDGKNIVCKRRYWYSPPIVLLGNLISRYRIVPVKVLNQRDWLQQELRMGQVLNREIKVQRSVLIVERLFEHSAAQYLEIPEVPLETRLNVVAKCTQSLADLHQQVVILADGKKRFLSHGDATVNNVAYDFATNSAQWFDFDLSHELDFNATLRHADDLRAFIFSAAGYFPLHSVQTLVDIALSNYANPAVFSTLQSLILRWQFDYDLLHLAQSLCSVEKHKVCKESILHVFQPPSYQ